MSLNDFPVELKSAILDELADDKTLLLRSRLLSKDFERLATPHAFKTLNLSRKRVCFEAFVKLFPEGSHVLVHVKEIKFRALERMHDVFQADKLEETLDMFAHLAKLPALRSLRLYFHHNFEEGMHEILGDAMSPMCTLQTGIFKNLAYLAVENGFYLNELVIDGLLSLPNDGLRSEGIGSLLARLTTLQIQLVTNDAEYFDLSDEDYCAFWKNDLIKVLAATQNLEDLTLISDVYTLGFYFGDWNRMNLPKLKRLRLDSIVFTNTAYYKQRFPSSSDGGVESFILHHSNTLEDLDLSSCAIEINDEDTNPRTWATIWKIFETALPHLRSFKFDPLPGRRPPEDDSELDGFEGYVYFLIECNYMNDFDGDPVDAALDRTAYASLQRTIQGRIGSA